MVTDTNGCTATSTVYDLTNVAVTSINYSGSVSVYPNPADNVLFIESPVSVHSVILSPDGKLIRQQDNVTSMDISNLPAGIYLVELFDAQGYRLMIQKLVKN
jgi:hypothetical protein